MCKNILLIFLLLCAGCAGKQQPIDLYSDNQNKKISSKSCFEDAEFNFSGSVYLPSLEDIDQLKVSWMEHGGAFPESKGIELIEKELRSSLTKPVLVSLYMTAYENADLKSKELGWSVSPVPLSIVELPEKDVPLHALMPVENAWAKYFLLRYDGDSLDRANSMTISNRRGKIELRLIRRSTDNAGLKTEAIQ